MNDQEAAIRAARDRIIKVVMQMADDFADHGQVYVTHPAGGLAAAVRAMDDAVDSPLDVLADPQWIESASDVLALPEGWRVMCSSVGTQTRVEILDTRCVRAWLRNPTRRQVLGVCRLMGWNNE